MVFFLEHIVQITLPSCRRAYATIYKSTPTRLAGLAAPGDCSGWTQIRWPSPAISRIDGGRSFDTRGSSAVAWNTTVTENRTSKDPRSKWNLHVSSPNVRLHGSIVDYIFFMSSKHASFQTPLTIKCPPISGIVVFYVTLYPFQIDFGSLDSRASHTMKYQRRGCQPLQWDFFWNFFWILENPTALRHSAILNAFSAVITGTTSCEPFGWWFARSRILLFMGWWVHRIGWYTIYTQ